MLKGFSLFITAKERFEDTCTLLNRNWYYSCECNFNNSFLQDKVFEDNEDYLLLLDGVILNKTKFVNQCSLSWKETLIQLYNQQGDTFFREFRGSFCGILLDKRKNKLICFEDHIGSKPIYYYKDENNIYLSNNITDIYRQLEKNNINCHLSIISAYALLSYGFMLENKTLCSEIFRILPGSYILVTDDIKETSYYQLDNTRNSSIKESDAIEIIDSGFRDAIKEQFDKDMEYNVLQHYVELSGGLDSRMTSWVAHDMGYTQQLNVTFSQSGYLDERIAQHIAADLQHEWLFKSLDNGNYLFDVDEITEITGGNVLYVGSAHSNSLNRLLSFDRVGMAHSGQLGDVVIGTFYEQPIDNIPFKLGNGAYSKKLIERLQGNIEFKYKNQEIGNFYLRGFNGANNGLVIFNQYLETMSPFYNVDFLDKVLKIPVELRYQHYIYKRWIITKYYNASQYKWEKMNAKITDSCLNIFGRQLPINQIGAKIVKKLTTRKDKIDTIKHMNPVGYNLRMNEKLKIFYDDYFDESMLLINESQLKEDLKIVINTGSAIEKTQAISLLSAIRKLNLKC